MPWPSKITRAFATVGGGVNISVHESQYYGPYNKLLYTLFPADSDFIVSPNYIPGNKEDGADFIISFEITLRQHPVLILEVKPPQHLLFASTRKAADRQMRERLFDLRGVWRRCRLRSLPPTSFRTRAPPCLLRYQRDRDQAQLLRTRGDGGAHHSSTCI